MCNSVIDIGIWFFQKAKLQNSDISITRLLIMAYLAQGWHLERFGYRLFNDRIEAWSWGPVAPELYHAVVRQGPNVTGFTTGAGTEISADKIAHLDVMWDLYGSKSTSYLTALARDHKQIWFLALKARGQFTPIGPHELRDNFAAYRALHQA